MSKIIKHKFETGQEFTGTIEELRDVAKALKLPLKGLEDVPKGFYNSGSSGLVEIKSMNSYHLRRAIIKSTKEYMAKVFVQTDTDTEFLEKYAGLQDDVTIMGMLEELSARSAAERKAGTADSSKKVKAATIVSKAVAPKKAVPVKKSIKKGGA